MRLVGAELLKLVTAYRTILGIVLAQTAIVLLGTIVTVYDVANDPRCPRPRATSLGSNVLLFATLFGVLIATTEYRHGTITLTFLATPVRERVIAAKIAAALIGSTPRAAAARSLRWDRDNLGRQQVRLRVRRRRRARRPPVPRRGDGGDVGLFIGATLTRQSRDHSHPRQLFFAEPALAISSQKRRTISRARRSGGPGRRRNRHLVQQRTADLGCLRRRSRRPGDVLHEAPRHHVASGPLTRMRVGAGR